MGSDRDLSVRAPYSAGGAGHKIASIKARAWRRRLNVVSVLMFGVAGVCVTQIPVITVHTVAAL